MNDILLSPIPLTEMEMLIQKSVGAAMACFKTSTPIKDENEKPFMGFDRACEFLDIAPRTLKGYIAAGAIPNIKKEGKVYFERTELIQWLRSGRRKTTIETSQEATSYLQSKRK